MTFLRLHFNNDWSLTSFLTCFPFFRFLIGLDKLLLSESSQSVAILNMHEAELDFCNKLQNTWMISHSDQNIVIATWRDTNGLKISRLFARFLCSFLNKKEKKSNLVIHQKTKLVPQTKVNVWLKGKCEVICFLFSVLKS